MASSITMIRKPEYPDHHEAIELVSGLNVLGQVYTRSRVDVALDILYGRESYYVSIPGVIAWVESYSMHNTHFIKTYPDWTRRDNLLSLPRF